ncbi:MAG: hypothetical protein LQ351_001714 [Letrouitia transgressa]|nr:MAG: hypothetical protein LQ351_001714 [Letrouitia transgressa]
MFSKQIPTYFLAPNFQIQLNQSIRLGDIIIDPDDPLHHLSRLPDNDLSGEGKPSETFQGPGARKNQLWTTFQKTVSMSSRDIKTKFEIETLETFRYRPTAKQLERRMSDPKVKDHFKPSLKKRTAYMVTGLMVAKGLRTRNPLSQTPGASAGDSVFDDGGVQEKISRSSRTETDTEESKIIFAYSLAPLRVKGWWRKEMELETESYSSGALS